MQVTRKSFNFSHEPQLVLFKEGSSEWIPGRILTFPRVVTTTHYLDQDLESNQRKSCQRWRSVCGSYTVQTSPDIAEVIV